MRRILLVLIALLLTVPTAGAVTLLEDPVKLKLQVVGVGGFRFKSPDQTAFQLELARLGFKVDHPRWGGAHIQVEGSLSSFDLVDASAWIDPVKGLRIRAGRFKTLFSEEFLLSKPYHPFVDRPGMAKRATRRHTGMDVTGSFETGPVGIDLTVGAFDNSGFQTSHWTVLGSFRVRFPHALSLRASVALSAGADRDGQRAADIAFVWRGEQVWLHGEYLLRFPEHTDIDHAGVFMLGVPIDVGAGVVLEPKVAADIVDEDLATVVGLNVRFIGWDLALRLDYRSDFATADVGHSLALTLQGATW